MEAAMEKEPKTQGELQQIVRQKLQRDDAHILIDPNGNWSIAPFAREDSEPPSLEWVRLAVQAWMKELYLLVRDDD
jgi:hypothetical protein